MANNVQQTQEDESFHHLPILNFLGDKDHYQLQGFWLDPRAFEGVMEMKGQLQLLPHDIILSSFPKTGTTWLKALVYSIVNYNSDSDPLLTHNPHQLIPSLELKLYKKGTPPNLTEIPSPRIIATHLPYELLPENIKSSGCRIIYITRNPRDTFISILHFYNRRIQEPFPLETAFESFCRGLTLYGPFFKHVLGYWKGREKRVHFVMYEDIIDDAPKEVKKLAEFLGCPLKSEEMIEEIAHKCSFERLSNLEVNKSSEIDRVLLFPPVAFFRRGIVGDWRNYFTPKMIEKLDAVTQTELEGSGLQFKMLIGAITEA